MQLFERFSYSRRLRPKMFSILTIRLLLKLIDFSCFMWFKFSIFLMRLCDKSIFSCMSSLNVGMIFRRLSLWGDRLLNGAASIFLFSIVVPVESFLFSSFEKYLWLIPLKIYIKAAVFFQVENPRQKNVWIWFPSLMIFWQRSPCFRPLPQEWQSA